MKKFSEIDVLALGNTSMIAGVVFSGTPSAIFWLPNEELTQGAIDSILMTDDDWKKLLDQTDNTYAETMVGNVKAIVRKCLRVIDQNISWQVYERDGYTCRYCGRTGIPLTVDHIDLWEVGGATVAENLISACKRCNKLRGNMTYRDWLNSQQYKLVSSALLEVPFLKNKEVLTTLPYLETIRVKEIKSR